MDHELKQRLIGAVVVTALCAIFIPMLFDDPVDNTGQQVSELSIPAPVDPSSDTASKLPANSDQISKLSDPEPLSTETPADIPESTGAAEEVIEESDAGHSKQGRSGESLYAESEGYTHEDAGADGDDEAEDNRAASHSKHASAEKPLSADAVRSKVPSAQDRDSHFDVKKQFNEPGMTKPITVKRLDKSAGSGFAREAPEGGRAGIAQSENEQPMTARNVEALADPARQTPLKSPSNAKSLAAAVADAKNSTVAPPKAAPKLVRWYIQVGSFSKKENAMSLWDSLREQGLPASMDTVQTDKGISYRLRVGPELDGKKAAAMKLRLDKQNIKAILISE